VSCSACGGRGYTEKADWEMTVGDAGQTQGQRSIVKQVPCGNCSGGRVHCNACSGGQVTCTGCSGAGRVNCGPCGASGSVVCSACAGSGVTHELGQIRALVDRRVEIRPGSDHAEDQETILRRVPLEHLGELAEMRLGQRQRNDLQSSLDYRGSVAQETADVQTATARLSIRSYGPDRRIFVYHNLIGELLSPDLAELERAVGQHSLLQPLESSALSSAVNRFLTSEVNVLIAEESGKLTDLEKQDLINAKYVERARNALRKALPRLYLPLVMKPALWLVPAALALTVATMTGVHFYFFHRHVMVWSKFTFALLGAAQFAAAWAAFDWRAMSQIKKMLSALPPQRLSGRFAGVRKKVWIGAAIEIAALAWVYGYVPKMIERFVFRF